MNRNRIDKNKLRLYAITDSSRLGNRTLAEAVEGAICGGATLVQLREKELDDSTLLAVAKEIKRITDNYGVPLIINDRPDIALKSGASGVHLGQTDGSVSEARKLLGDDMIIGVSAHNVKEAITAEKNGADYLGAGAVFPTSTKSGTLPVSAATLRAICDSVSIPVVAIGGITADNIGQLTDTGIDGVAVVSSIFSEKDPAESAAHLISALDSAKIGKSKSDRFASLSVKGAIFDVDGTILDSMYMWTSVASRFLQKNGINPPESINEQMTQRTLEESAAVFRDTYGIPGTISEIIAAVLEMVTDDYRYHLKCKPGIVDIIRDFAGHGIPMYIATATNREMIVPAMERLGLSKYFSGIITCSELGVPKTSPDIYLYAADQLGTRPEETLVFEDVHHAVLTASLAGFPVVAIYDEVSASQSNEIRTIADLYLESCSDWPGIPGK